MEEKSHKSGMDEQWRNFIKVIEGNHEIGGEIYGMLRKYAVNETEIFVCPMHIGDTLLIAAYAEAYKMQKHVRKLVMVSYSVPPETLEMFPGVDAALLLERDQMEALQFFMTVHGLRYENGVRFAYHWNILQIEHATPSYMVLLNNRLLLGDLIRQILDLDSHAKMRCMQIPTDEQRIRENIGKYGKAVLLMPGTLTEKSLPISFWKQLAKTIHEMGFKVFTNYNGKAGETMIGGTEPLSTSLREMAELADVFPLFVGVRSGACDLMALSGARVVVVFSGKSGENHIEMVPEDRPNAWLGDIEENQKIKQYLYLPEKEEELIGSICGMLHEKGI